MKTIVCFNRLGGTGKSTTTMTIASAFNRDGFRTLMVDADAQHILSNYLNVNADGVSVYDVMRGTIPAQRAVIKTDCGSIIAGSENLAKPNVFADDNGQILRNMKNVDQRFALKNALAAIAKDFDVCVVDCSPALNIISINALAMADYLIIPVRADIASVQALDQMQSTIDAVKQYNKGLKIAGLIVSNYRKTSLALQIIDVLKEKAEAMDTRVFDTYVRQCVALQEAQVYCQSIFEYSPRCNASADYTNIYNELKGVIEL